MPNSSSLTFGPELRASFSLDCMVSDLRAFLDSYDVELCKADKCLVRLPIACVLGQRSELEVLKEISIDRLVDLLFPVVDINLCLRLIRHGPFDGLGGNETRWPFWTNSELKINLTYDTQWWEFIFSPGKTYEEREIDDREMVKNA